MSDGAGGYWHERFDEETGGVFYVEDASGASTWEDPRLPETSAEWQPEVDESGHTYYVVGHLRHSRRRPCRRRRH